MVDYTDRIRLLKEKGATTPEYAQIIDYFVGIYAFLADEGKNCGVSVEIPTDDSTIRNGFPLVSAESVSIDQGAASRFMTLLAERLSALGREGKELLERIRDRAAEGEIPFLHLFGAILSRNRRPIDDLARDMDVPPPLLEYLLEIHLRAALEEAASTVDPSRFTRWEEAVCPFCGSRPGISSLEGEEGNRYLHCSTCFTAWRFKRIRCPSCGCEDPDKLSYFLVDTESVRVDTCKGCSRAIKTVDRRKGGVESIMPADILDVVTLHLDLVASREGFERGR